MNFCLFNHVPTIFPRVSYFGMSLNLVLIYTSLLVHMSCACICLLLNCTEPTSGETYPASEQHLTFQNTADIQGRLEGIWLKFDIDKELSPNQLRIWIKNVKHNSGKNASLAAYFW